MSGKKKKNRSAAAPAEETAFRFDETVAGDGAPLFSDDAATGEIPYFPRNADDFEPMREDVNTADFVSFADDAPADPAETVVPGDAPPAENDEPYTDDFTGFPADVPADEPASFAADAQPSADDAIYPDDAAAAADEAAAREEPVLSGGAAYRLKPDYSALKPRPGTYAYVPYESRFDALFGHSRFFGVASILTGIYALFWIVMYFILLMQRSMLFTQAQLTMANRGEMAYSVSFSNPLLSALRIMLYLLPAVLLLWVIALKNADRKRAGLGNKKVIVVILCILVFLGALSLFDVGAAGLVFDIAKN